MNRIAAFLILLATAWLMLWAAIALPSTGEVSSTMAVAAIIVLKAAAFVLAGCTFIGAFGALFADIEK